MQVLPTPQRAPSTMQTTLPLCLSITSTKAVGDENGPQLSIAHSFRKLWAMKFRKLWAMKHSSSFRKLRAMKAMGKLLAMKFRKLWAMKHSSTEDWFKACQIEGRQSSSNVVTFDLIMRMTFEYSGSAACKLNIVLEFLHTHKRILCSRQLYQKELVE